MYGVKFDCRIIVIIKTFLTVLFLTAILEKVSDFEYVESFLEVTKLKKSRIKCYYIVSSE